MPTSPPFGPHRSHAPRRFLLAACLAAAAACESTSVEPDPAVAPFVGDWDATSVLLTNKADPETSVDIIEVGATFTLNVQPSGNYLAIITYLGQDGSESGRMTVSGNIVTLTPEQPPGRPVTSGTFAFVGADAFTLEGETAFDFNLDGTAEDALLHIDFVRS